MRLLVRNNRMRRINSLNPESGTVLITVIWIVIVLAGLVLVFARSMRVEATAVSNQVSAIQAESIATGALRYIQSHLEDRNGIPPSEEEMPSEAVKLGDGYFWILRTPDEESTEHAFGLADEAARINLNVASEETLLKLPGMDEDLAAAIIDWRDEDEETSSYGAEGDYYLSLPTSYNCKNSALETFDELLFVKDFTRSILYGEDANRNGVLDSNEDDADKSEPADNRDGSLDRGLIDYVTVFSSEPNINAEGTQRANVNERQELTGVLQEVLAGNRFTEVLAQLGRSPIENIFDFYFRSDLTPEEFGQLEDRITASNESTVQGLVNVNTASRSVLASLPGLDEGDAEELISARAGRENDGTTVWAAGTLPKEKALLIGGSVTGRSFQYRADIVSAVAGGRAWKRYRVFVDAASSPARVLYFKDLTHLGWPLDAETWDALRDGSIEDFVAVVGGR